MFGMAGGSAGQFLVGPIIASGVAWSTFWVGMGVVGLVISGLLFLLLPPAAPQPRRDDWLKDAAAALTIVFSNPQSILCGDDRRAAVHSDDDLRHGLGRALSAGGAGLRLRRGGDALVDGAARLDHRLPAPWLPLGSDRAPKTGDRGQRRRAAVCLAWILYGPAGVLPPYVIGLVAGIASGAAMLPYTVIKEANPPA